MTLDEVYVLIAPAVRVLGADLEINYVTETIMVCWPNGECDSLLTRNEIEDGDWRQMFKAKLDALGRGDA